MDKDTHKTKVLFLIEQTDEEHNISDIFAYFPNENYNTGDNNTKVCYSHIGQHSACVVDYAKECKQATPNQYEDLKKELENIGYNLEILNS